MAEKYMRILAALDGGITRRLVAKRALALAEKNDAHLLFVHVIDMAVMEVGATGLEMLCQETEHRLRKDITDLIVASKGCEKIPLVDLEVYLGRPADVLLNHVANEFKPDLVVCGDRGFSNLKYSFLGSVSAALVRNLKCDVLVVKNASD